MCVGLGLLGVIASVASTGLGIIGGLQQQRAQEKAAKDAAEYNAQVAANEIQTRRQLAQAEIAKGAAERDRAARSGLRTMGQMRSTMAASGFEIDTGSNLSLLGESAQELQYDANVIDQNTAMSVWQQQAGMTSAQNQADFSRYQASQASAGKTGSILSAAGTLLGGIGYGLGKYSEYQATSSLTPVATTNSQGVFQQSGCLAPFKSQFTL
jgi:hypothetical protein